MDHKRDPIKSFFGWLLEQRIRTDDVGRFANVAVKDKTFPRNFLRLHYFLHYYRHEPDNRRLVKIAHAEWRKLRHFHKNPGNHDPC